MILRSILMNKISSGASTCVCYKKYSVIMISFLFHFHFLGLVCARDYMILIMSEYSTGFCILAMAVERFASVCANSRKTTRALKITRRLICVSLTVVVTLLLGLAAYASYASYNPYSCLAHFYGHQYYRVVIDGIIFFLGPAMMAGWSRP